MKKIGMPLYERIIKIQQLCGALEDIQTLEKQLEHTKHPDITKERIAKVTFEIAEYPKAEIEEAFEKANVATAFKKRIRKNILNLNALIQVSKRYKIKYDFNAHEKVKYKIDISFLVFYTNHDRYFHHVIGTRHAIHLKSSTQEKTVVLRNQEQIEEYIHAQAKALENLRQPGNSAHVDQMIQRNHKLLETWDSMSKLTETERTYTRKYIIIMGSEGFKIEKII